MEKKEICERLRKLCQLDIDAARAYTQALDKIDIPAVHESLTEFRADHERHIRDLSAVIAALGELPPAQKPDLKGFLIEGFTAVRSMTGNAGALKAMRGNEMLTNSTYSKALDEDLPQDIRAMVERNYQDEMRHLAYIQRILDSGMLAGESRESRL